LVILSKKKAQMSAAAAHGAIESVAEAQSLASFGLSKKNPGLMT
jgi:hypothetical protein